MAKVDTPAYGARSRQGRLVLGREHFCAVDASPITISTVDVARLWLTGGGVLGFSDDGDVEMVTPSGERIWSLAQGLGGAQKKLKYKGKLNQNEGREMKEKKESIKKTGDRQMEKLKRVEEFKTRQKEKNERKKKESEQTTHKNKRRRKRIFSRNDGAARDASANENAPSPSQGTPPSQNVLGRVLSWARPSRKGAGGQSG